MKHAPTAMRWPAVALVVAGVALLARGDDPPDLLSFGERGGLMLSGHLSEVYAGSWNQAGPLQLLVARLLMVGSSTDRPLFGIELVVDFALLGLLARVARRSGRPFVGQLILVGVGLAWLGPAGLWSGHPIEVVIPVLWLLAGHWAVSGRWTLAGAALGVSVLIAPWAVLGFGVAFAGRTRPALAAVALAIGVTLGGYLPFALSGHFDLFSHVWPISPHTLLHLLAPGLVRFSWGLRVLQAAVAGGGCLLVSRRLRGRADLIWVGPLIAVLARILLDPIVLGYYWLPAGLLVIAAAALSPRTARADMIVLALLGYLTYFGAVGLAPALFCGLALVLTVFLAARRSRSVAERTRFATVREQLAPPSVDRHTYVRLS